MTALRYALILALVFLPATPFATTFQVTKTQDTNGDCGPSNCSLREAVEAANTENGADVIDVPAGTYLLRLGQLTVTGDVVIAGAGQANTIVDGKRKGRVFEIEANNTADISGLTIRNGAVSVAPVFGGGILNRGTLTLTDSTLSGNRAIGGDYYLGSYATGGGLYNYGSATLMRTTVSGNTSEYWGGGLYNAPTGTLTVSDSTVSDNYARYFAGGIGSYALGDDISTLVIANSTISGNSVMREATYYYYFGGYGGGIVNSGVATVTDSTVTGNTAGEAGGIANFGFGVSALTAPTLTLVNTTVSGNVAETFSGGIENFLGTLTLTNSTVTGNTARFANGGILNSSATLYLTDSTVSENHALDLYSVSGGITNLRYRDFDPPGVAVLTNTTVSGNTAHGQGGGIWNAGTLTVTSSTVSDNTAKSGGGIKSFTRYGDIGLANLKNSIVADNGVDNCAGSTSSSGFNLSNDFSCNLTGMGDLAGVDAMLFPLQDNGGPTETHALRPGSPAIDAGSLDCPLHDQRGVPRPEGACDIGAFESDGEVLVLGVEIDLKPGSDPNCVNPDEPGVVAVITLGDADLDVRDIVEMTLRFGGALQAQGCDLGDQKGKLADGFEDLTCHFDRQEVTTWPAPDSDCGDIVLTGELFDGTLIEGVDRACLAGEPTCGTKKGGRGR